MLSLRPINLNFKREFEACILLQSLISSLNFFSSKIVILEVYNTSYPHVPMNFKLTGHFILGKGLGDIFTFNLRNLS